MDTVVEFECGSYPAVIVRNRNEDMGLDDWVWEDRQEAGD